MALLCDHKKINMMTYYFQPTLQVIIIYLFFSFQSSSVSVVGSDLREVRAGDVHAERPVGDGRRRLLVGVVQRGHRSFLKTSKKHFFSL